MKEITNILWDLNDFTEKEQAEILAILPTVVLAEDDKSEDEISDLISDCTGFCHKGFLIKPTCGSKKEH